MREGLKHVFSQQVVVEDKSMFYYTIQPYELTNALGNSIAILKEYHFTKKEDDNEPFSCKLYRTKEGNWYDIEEAKIITEKKMVRMLKFAIDSAENNTVLK